MYKREPPKQPSLLYTEDVYKALIPKDHFLYQVKEHVDFSFVNDLCRHLYNKDVGRPVVNTPERMLKAGFVQTYYRFSDREMENEANFNIVIKWFLGYDLVDEPFDHSALSHFRALAGPELYKQMFDRVLDQLVVKGLVKKDEIQFIDSTDNKAKVHIPTTIQLLFRTLIAVMAEIKKASRIFYSAVAHVVMFNNVLTKDKAGKYKEPFEYNMKEFEKRRKLADLVMLARRTISVVREKIDLPGMNIDEQGRQKVMAMVELLERVLQENIEEAPAGAGEEPGIKAKEGPAKDRVVTPVDPDCRHGAKSDDKRFTGYKTTFTATGKGVITGVEVTPGNHPDPDSVIPMVDEMRETHGLVPEKMGGDKAYGSGENRRELEAKGIQLVAPLKQPSNKEGKNFFTVDRFMFDPKGKTVTCIGGQTTSKGYYNRFNKNTMFHFSAEVCGACPYKKDCTDAAYRTVCISDYYREFQAAAAYSKTEEYKEVMKDRKGIERLFSEGKGQHGLGFARYWGLAKMRVQAYLTAIVINAKRLVKGVSVSARQPLGEVAG